MLFARNLKDRNLFFKQSGAHQLHKSFVVVTLVGKHCAANAYESKNAPYTQFCCVRMQQEGFACSHSANLATKTKGPVMTHECLVFVSFQT